MAIEFRCSQCNRLLRTGDDTAGKQAQCPECGAITLIPGGPVSPVPATLPAEPSLAAEPSASTTQNGSESAPVPQPVLGPSERPSVNDTIYGSHTPTISESHYAEASAKVAWPAILLICCGILGVLVQCAVFVNIVRNGAAAVIDPKMRVLKPELAAIPDEVIIQIGVVTGAIQLGICLLMIYGAWQMKRLRSYTLAMVAVVIGLIPCMTPCCVLPIPFAVWGLLTLNNDFIKAAFRR